MVTIIWILTGIAAAVLCFCIGVVAGCLDSMTNIVCDTPCPLCGHIDEPFVYEPITAFADEEGVPFKIKEKAYRKRYMELLEVNLTHNKVKE